MMRGHARDSAAVCRKRRNWEIRKQKSGFPNFSFPNFSFSPKDPVMLPFPFSHTFLALTRKG